MDLPISMAIDKELTLKSIFCYRHMYLLAIEVVADGSVDIRKIVTNIYGFPDIQNAMDESVHDKKRIVKLLYAVAADQIL